MATYYCRKTGVDGAGHTGLTGDPWLTIAYSLTRLADGDTLNVGDGTYSEEPYLTVANVFTVKVTIQGENADRTLVIIQGGSSANYDVLINGGAAYIEFKNVTFGNHANTVGNPVYLYTCNNLTFTNCNFNVIGTAAGGYNAVYMRCATADTTNITFTNCNAIQTARTGTWPVYGWACAKDAAHNIDTITWTDCTAITDSDCLYCTGVTNVTITGGTYTCTSTLTTKHTILMGVDGTGGDPVTGSITGATIVSSPGTAHNLCIGSGCRSFTATGNLVIGGLYGIVAKECGIVTAGVTITNNRISGGGTYGILAKAAYYTTISGNIVYSPVAGSVGLGMTANGANKCTSCTVTGNKIVTCSTATTYYQEAGSITCTVNDQTLYQWGTGNFGTVNGTAAVTTLAGIKTAWAAYGDGTNENRTTTGSITAADVWTYSTRTTTRR